MSKEYTLPKPEVEIPLEIQIDKIWKRKVDKLPVYKDLPRLAGRITIDSINKPLKKKTQATVAVVTETVESEKKRKNSKCLSLKLSQYFDLKGQEEVDKLEIQPDENNDTKTWKRVKTVLFQLSEIFESKETYQRVVKTFENYKQPTDYELHLGSLFKECFGDSDQMEQSKVVKILKLVHQNIIYVGCFEIKVKVPFLLTHMTKDMRGPNGWQISIFEGKDTVTVTHSRQEESLPTAPPDQQFQLEWQLHITLNKDLSEITSVTLKIVNLSFKETTSQQFKDEINRKLCSGNLFVY
ncbi:hypothetical protein DLAC_00365 [Tieghemostelium lacteum]|uniref:Ras guanine nucleotide exchange factor glfB-like C-terminal domain-containing protein n=1 Tax=Tieghemostelium lacteum TaxID=361077 RepID=A0A152A9J0_TIELA|nr:hypothetical protein DLAC_00365 [Tieghemostelium lacteum]|eukprot:KYR02889.1 hypothetical protein DLAC_00365 [Tieghemostelium lacteum]